MLAKKLFSPKIHRIISLLKENGATEVLVVGGFVRDYLMGKAGSSDIDIEVYGLDFSRIAEILKSHFSVNLVGQSFGVLKVGPNIDIALPRRESKYGIGHKEFNVRSDPAMSFEEAFARRDFTINAIGMREDGSLVDPYNGQNDIRRKILRATSPAFKEDPLRVLRAMQFAARFGFQLEKTTIKYCREVYPEFNTLSEERIYEEWKKWCLMSRYPSMGLEVLEQTGWINVFPELAALTTCEQNPQWHPEGNVWEHTKLVCNEMERLFREQRMFTQSPSHNNSSSEKTGENSKKSKEWFRTNSDFGNFFVDEDPVFTDEERIILMLAALGHDFGKPQVTFRDETGTIRSYGHAEAGAILVQNFLKKLKAPLWIQEAVPPLVKEHMVITHTRLGVPGPRAVRRLACRLAPANIRLWAALCQCDALGCFSIETVSPTDLSLAENLTTEKKSQNSVEQYALFAKKRRLIRFNAAAWLRFARETGVQKNKPQALVLGRDLIPLGVKPGPEMGRILALAYEAQLDGKITTTENGIQWLKEKEKIP